MSNARAEAPAPPPRGPPKITAPVADGSNKGFNVGMLQRVQVVIKSISVCTEVVLLPALSSFYSFIYYSY